MSDQPRASSDDRQRGQGLVEYALILILVSVVAIWLLISMGGQLKNLFSNVLVGLGT